ncbi:UDP-N-acetylmuramoylalanyl-D-glutamyl-2, 6-diaminopimelate--D-alanyl-D-alanine ligase [Pseudoxanthomonas kalamensis DSM 18571]|uniref:UDP-N-acetylmuramoyl-tripeptide--D-alanyl-D- alanine ligase n=1 Tax=Pseudoxanthomonas kalamensis TaxID=289483 RepID=UPI001390C457|nr:UDP-N-acetylmuramoyl-tripeptide--D-alanyl-D-alanine ligase [Pseudoxanthomonas kalamensis]KAF1708845.1 UDP-N-acetylmuramoylalanyl-D-glutamyl-2, 6-diaminopimelate--D-alanyl-D-alanine ligase [Pseudoxanthomonas kalamensis DSM 18571]
MRRLPLSLLAHWADGELHGEDVAVDALNNDTRSLVPGSVYVALRGERFDGHDFTYDAAMRGAAALLVEHAVEVEVPQVVVADSQLALAKIAAALQRDRTGKVVAITGSNGKTSVKTLAQAVFERAGATSINPGNRNNEIGLPLAVINAPEDAEFYLYEMGAGKPGDIAYLTDIARPDVALVNNIAPAHLERMDTLLGVAETKGAIYDALPADGVAVVNADDAFGEYFAARAQPRRVLRFGLDVSADLTAADIDLQTNGSRFMLRTLQGDAAVALALPGRHNVLNALAAAALATACDIPLPVIVAGLAAAQPVPGRQVAHRLPHAVLIDDSYNANPGSLAAAIDTLAVGDGPAWLVLGDMRELGAEGERLHAEAGRRAKAAGIARLYALGPLSEAAASAFGAGGQVFDSHAQLAEALAADIAAANGADALRVLVKGSRGSAMDRVVAALLAADNDNDGTRGTANAA